MGYIKITFDIWHYLEWKIIVEEKDKNITGNKIPVI